MKVAIKKGNSGTLLRVVALLIVTGTMSACSHMEGAGTEMAGKTQVRAEQASMAEDLTTINTGLRDQWGIEIVALRTTMQGMMVDLRYKVLDAAKAASLLDLNTKAWLDVKKNGARLGVPHSVKVGELRQSTAAKKIKEGRDYFILFGNPGARYVSSGDEVTLVIGDMTVESLTVQ